MKEGREEEEEEGRMGICQVLKRERAFEAFVQFWHMTLCGEGVTEPCQASQETSQR